MGGRGGQLLARRAREGRLLQQRLGGARSAKGRRLRLELHRRQVWPAAGRRVRAAGDGAVAAGEGRPGRVREEVAGGHRGRLLAVVDQRLLSALARGPGKGGVLQQREHWAGSTKGEGVRVP